MNFEHTKLTAMLVTITLLVGCRGGTLTPATPPTFVMAWTGSDSSVNTLQSTDGATWVLPAVAPGPGSMSGAALAHDGSFSWLLLWNSGGSLSYVVGIGGLPSATASSGITWEGSATSLRTRSPVQGTPALTFANGKWVALFRDAAGELRIVRSVLDASSMAPMVDAPSGIVALGGTPSLAYGSGTYVAAFTGPSRDVVAFTSVNNSTWSGPSTVRPYSTVDIGGTEFGLTPNPVSLSFDDGRFYAVGRISRHLAAGNSNAIASTIVVYSSSDGVTWTTVVDFGSGPFVESLTAGTPGGAVAGCNLVVGYFHRSSGSNVRSTVGTPAPCANPTSISFGPEVTVTTAATAVADRKMAVVFGEGH